MKKHHYTIVLAILFLTGLIILWWAPDTELDPNASDAILPALSKVPVADIKRLEIDRSGAEPGKAEAKDKAREAAKPDRIVVERREEGRWQMLEPIDAAADPSLVETLVRNLKDMRKSLDSGTIHDAPGTFGLAQPSSIVKVYGDDPKVPLATLEVGKSIRELLYLRPEGGKGIEVIDPRMLSMLGLAPSAWRDKSLFHLPSFRVGTLAVAGAGRDLKAVRDDGHWRLLRPFTAVADDDKVEGMVAELTSLKVARGDDGFVADNVKDDAKYGLDRPTMTIELKSAVGPGKPQTLVVGKANPDPDHPDLHYARTGDQDDVVLVDVKNFRDLGLDPNALRSHKVAELTPARVEFIRIDAFGRTFDLSRTANGWEQLRPTHEAADPMTVQRLLTKLAEAQATDFIDPSKVSKPGIDPPQMTIKIWQASPLAKAAIGLDTPPKSEPRLDLQIGSHDVLRKHIYARLEGAKDLLSIPDALLEALPQSPLAFRDRTVLSLSPTRITRLKISREGKLYELAAPAQTGSKSTHWNMVAPVEAPADEEAITKMVMLLSTLTAEGFVTDQIGDGKAFGFHAPTLTVTWTMPAEATADQVKSRSRDHAGTETGTLRIGKKVPKSDLSYANIEGSPIVFTLRAAAIDPFESEFHTHRVMTFPKASARRLVLHWSDRTLAFKPQQDATGKGIMWVPETTADTKGLDLTRLATLVETMAHLNTPRFVQYRGPIPDSSGLARPRLVIEVYLADNTKRELRLGYSNTDQTFATTASGKSGPVFFVTGPAWHDLIQAAPRGGDLPENVFAPEAEKKPTEGEAKALRH